MSEKKKGNWLIKGFKKILGNRLMSILLTVLFTFAFANTVNYFALPAINLRSEGFWWFILLVLTFGAFMGWTFNYAYNKIKKISDEEYDYWRREPFSEKASKKVKKWPIPIIIILIIVVWILAFFITSIPGWKCFNATKYSELIEIEDGNFEEDVIEADSSNITIVDQETAQKLGDRTLGSIKNASWYEVNDEYNLVSINGEQYRVSPLEYRGYWEARKAKGLPGYILVNAKTQKAEFVTLEESMQYSPSAYFSKNLQRHLHFQYPNYMFGKSFMEPDDNGKVYWITSVKKTTIGVRGGMVEENVIITDAVTGESQEYTQENLPEWVDHSYSVSYLMQLIEWHYKYANGFINPSNTNIYRTSYSFRDSMNEEEDNAYTPFDGYNSVMSKKGEMMFYTGITPNNNAETNIGFVLVSPRTGKAKFYECDGAEEYSAQLSVEGLVSNLRYSASFPTVINVDGIETYFMTLKDGAGLVKKYALCNIEQYTDCVEADTLKEAIQKYKEKIGVDTSTTENEAKGETVETKNLEGGVSVVTQAQIDGYTYYYFSLDVTPNFVFMSSIENSNQQPLKLVSGANVKIEYYDSKEEGIGIVTEIVFN